MAFATAASPSKQQKETSVQWMWQADADPWSSSSVQKGDWFNYSDIETAIIEDAYQKKEMEVLLDNYHINFKHLVQISNNNLNHQRPVKRLVREREEGIRLRESRFLSEPIIPSQPFMEPGPSFFDSLESHFNIPPFEPLDDAFIPVLAESAAEGLITEGKQVGRQKEGEWMAEQLLNVIDGTEQEIWEVCTHLYTMESFLYKKMNEIMRLMGDKQHAQLVQTKALTFGPFAYILEKFNHSRTGLLTVYRGAQLSDDMIEQYRKITGTNEIRTFPAYTSTSRSREKAEQFGNVLFEIQIESDGLDIAKHSAYPDEEEVLLQRDFGFHIRQCAFDSVKKKWIIHLACLYW
ncbi:unnamed protein product [Rotaria sp. Silwood1]|nr:unnamed protein product [Rotaria sp. Silwood1]